jgi:putative ABC transport system permease protein
VESADGSELVEAAVVTREFFDLLGTLPVMGSTLSADPGDEYRIVVSDRFWRQRLGGRSDVVGQNVRINGRAYTVTGVMPPTFRHPSTRMTPAFWAPLTVEPAQTGRYLHVVARLAPVRSLDEAITRFQSIASSVVESHVGSHRGWSATVQPLREALHGTSRNAALLLFVAAALVLAVACVNVANLTLARNAHRVREFTVRAALGAGHGRLFRQVLYEAALIATAGALAGLALVWFFLEPLAVAGAALLPDLPPITTDARVVLFSTALAFRGAASGEPCAGGRARSAACGSGCGISRDRE